MLSHRNSAPEKEADDSSVAGSPCAQVKTSLKAGHNNVGERKILSSNMFSEFKNIMKMLKRFLKIATLENKVKI